MNLSYQLNLDDDTRDTVLKDEEFYNYVETSLHSFDSSYEALYQDIIDDDYIVENYIYPRKYFSKYYVKNSIKLWKELGINLHDINIFKIFKNPYRYKVVNDKFLSSYKLSNAIELPLEFQNIMQWDSKCMLLEASKTSLDYKDIIFKKIVLPKLEKKCAATIYAHELAHTQLLTSDGGTNSIFNEETIPILMEHIFANEVDKSNVTLNYVRNERLMSVAKFINSLDLGNKIKYAGRVTAEKYIISSLQAIKLANIYLDGDSFIREEMLKNIDKVFKGDILVEDMLNKYEANYYEVDKDIKKLKLTRS